MNITLTPELEKLLQEKVESGLYVSASDVVREALHLLQVRDQMHENELRELRDKIAVGLEQLDRGEGIPGEQVFDELRRLSQRQRKTKKKP